MKKRFMICTGGFFLAVIAAFIFMFNCAKALLFRMEPGLVLVTDATAILK